MVGGLSTKAVPLRDLQHLGGAVTRARPFDKPFGLMVWALGRGRAGTPTRNALPGWEGAPNARGSRPGCPGLFVATGRRPSEVPGALPGPKFTFQDTRPGIGKITSLPSLPFHRNRLPHAATARRISRDLRLREVPDRSSSSPAMPFESRPRHTGPSTRNPRPRPPRSTLSSGVTDSRLSERVRPRFAWSEAQATASASRYRRKRAY